MLPGAWQVGGDAVQDACKEMEFDTLALGDNHVIAVDAHGMAYCWGSQSHGQAGTGLPQEYDSWHMAQWWWVAAAGWLTWSNKLRVQLSRSGTPDQAWRRQHCSSRGRRVTLRSSDRYMQLPCARTPSRET